jgi:glucosamine-phosphate N-acetyltransferase
MTTQGEDSPLFSTALISPEVATSLPPNYTIRPLLRSDYKHGFLDVLRVLTTVGEISESKWDSQYDWISKRSDEYFIVVIWDGEKVVGAGTVVVERKLYVNGT